MKKSRKKGYTMVELVVTFALLAIFSATTAAIFARVNGTYYSELSRASATNVSEILLDKICGEISGAQGGVKPEYTLIISEGTKDGCLSSDDYSSLSSEHSCAAFCTRTGSPVYILADDNGYLLIHYRPINDNNLKLDAKDWTFDKKLYKNYTISNLSFRIVTSDNVKSNVLQVSITIENTVNGYSYSSSRFIECYNFSAVDIEKISYGAIAKDSAGN